jgi:cytochrome b6-f complex iron-sulfur subunit
MTTVTVESKPISRREFLYYVCGASGALALTGACGLSVWYAIPARVIPENGYFRVPFAALPTSYLPRPFNQELGDKVDFWLVNQASGLIALTPTCTREGCTYRWVDLNDRFECPCSGSKFRTDGTYIEGPAPRSLDRYTIYVTTPNERRETPSDGAAVSVVNATEIVVYKRRMIKGATRPNFDQRRF